MMKCKICEHECDDNKLSNHLWNKHRITSLRYIDEFLGVSPPKCRFCENSAKLLDLSRGFHSICGSASCESVLRSESAMISKSRLKQDSQRFNEFRNRTSRAVSKLWAERVKTGEDLLIREKITKTRRETLNKMTDEQRIEFFKRCINAGKFTPTHSSDINLKNIVVSNLSSFFNMDETLWQE